MGSDIVLIDGGEGLISLLMVVSKNRGGALVQKEKKAQKKVPLSQTLGQLNSYNLLSLCSGDICHVRALR